MNWLKNIIEDIRWKVIETFWRVQDEIAVWKETRNIEKELLEFEEVEIKPKKKKAKKKSAKKVKKSV